MVISQQALPLQGIAVEDAPFLSDQLITYIGNKRALLPQIESTVIQVERKIGRKLKVLDAFAGSGVVSRMLKSHSLHIVSNDIEDYARVLGDCYLTDRTWVPWTRLAEKIDEFNRLADAGVTCNGFIERLYAPRDDDNIGPAERVFYTRDNARRLDLFAQLISEASDDLRPFLLGPLLSAASVHANTAGVFKGFYKDRGSGIGRFGGSGQDALFRIKGQIRLRLPVTSRFSSKVTVLQGDANDLPDRTNGHDLVYLDPPYNQHPYGSNYFMLNLLVNYVEPKAISEVSGIPVDWRRSGYNVKKTSLVLLGNLVRRIDTRYLLISFNDEGFISPTEMTNLLEGIGQVTEMKYEYNTFRGSRNLRERSSHVTEHLYLVQREG
jgi:adenine-specific DNA-methyltransferase